MEKILLIDDEEAILRVLARSLRSDGYEVITAKSGDEGIQTFIRESPQIVLTDIKMPGMDGLEVLKRIKDIQSEAEVIIITGHGDIDSAIESLQYGASDFVNKPVRDKALAIALERARKKLDIRRQLKEYTTDLENMCQIATEEVRRKSKFTDRLIKSSNDGIVATDEEWKVIIFNPGAERIFGYSRYEIIRKTDIRDLCPTEIAEIFNEKAAQKKPMEQLPWKETLITSKDGDKIPVRFSGTVLYEDNMMVGSVGFFQDLREIKRLERELIHSERLAAIGQTVAGMAHGIKNILYGFKGGSYLVNLGIDKDDKLKLKDGWQMIQRNINRTSDLVLDLLSYSKEREPEYENCFPNEIAEEVCDLMKETANEHEIEILKDFGQNIGEMMLDVRTVHRSLMNLVSNAIDACIFDDNPNKDYKVIVKTGIGPDSNLFFEVTDNGSGMSDEVKSKLFTSFFSTKGDKGTGLGLLVTRKLIEEHNGTIHVASRLGGGTTFTVRLPYKKAGPAH
ncbi:MAG: response regulator [Deltaproteobacteria bacterium]|nr:response regulator [Deltaproteobacteria bacterium]